MRPLNARHDRGVGRRHPHMAMIGIVIWGIAVGEVNGEPVVRRSGVLAEMVVDEVQEHADRLHQNERRDDEQRDDTDPRGWWKHPHEVSPSLGAAGDITITCSRGRSGRERGRQSQPAAPPRRAGRMRRGVSYSSSRSSSIPVRMCRLVLGASGSCRYQGMAVTPISSTTGTTATSGFNFPTQSFVTPRRCVRSSPATPSGEAERDRSRRWWPPRAPTAAAREEARLGALPRSAGPRARRASCSGDRP